jgi:hypothetical protein
MKPGFPMGPANMVPAKHGTGKHNANTMAGGPRTVFKIQKSGRPDSWFPTGNRFLCSSGNILAERRDRLCHSCVTRNPDNLAFYCLDCGFGGSDTLALACQGRAKLLHSAKLFQVFNIYLGLRNPPEGGDFSERLSQNRVPELLPPSLPKTSPLPEGCLLGFSRVGGWRRAAHPG